ncbi:hypothetical protein SFRURICE_006289 [Spodoptera frugiperda]|nr:hypothetical protein SFRURICE_006289 [Spodoptera frugiperda]
MLRAGIEPATRCAAASCPATAPTVQSNKLPLRYLFDYYMDGKTSGPSTYNGPMVPLTAQLAWWLGNWLPCNVSRVRFPHGTTLCVIHRLLFRVWA